MAVITIIGIYKITNLLNNKIYIGQSNNIERRFQEHKSRNIIPIDQAIQKYGKENFSFEIIEECSLEQLNDRETYWIIKYNSIDNGYNFSLGGNSQSIGENNGNSILTEKDVIFIRQSYAQHKNKKEIYNLYADKISFDGFSHIWDGTSWAYIMPEVFTDENKNYYSKEATNGEKSPFAKFSDEEVVYIRERYVTESAKEIWQDYKNRCSYNCLQQILWGRHYKYLPIYKKKEKKWINK